MKQLKDIPLFFLGSQAVQAGESGAYEFSREKFSKHAVYAVMAGAVFITVPGFYIGRIMPLTGVCNSLVLTVTLLLLAALLVAAAMIFRRALAVESVPARKAFRPLMLSAALTLLSFSAGIAAAGYLWFFAGKIAVNLAEKDIIASGYSFENKKNMPKLPDEQNAVYFLKKAGEQKSMSSLFAGNLNDATGNDWAKEFYHKKNQTEFLTAFREDAVKGKLAAEDYSQARNLLKQHAQVLTLLDIAYEKKGVDWRIDYEAQPSWNIDIPKMAYMLSLGRLLACKAIVTAHDGQGAAALKAVREGLFIGDLSRQTGFLVGEMIDAAICKVVLNAARVALPAVDGKTASEGLLSSLKADERPAAVLKSVRWEFFHGGESIRSMGWLQFAETLSQENSFEYIGRNQKLRYVFCLFYRPFIMFDVAANDHDGIQKMKALGLPFSERKNAWDAAKEAYERSGWIMGRMARFNADQLYIKSLEAMANCRLAKAAVAAKLFHEKNKRWPEAAWELDELRNGEYRDPFSDEANLRIQKYKTGIMIYSVGPDGFDDQGKPTYSKDVFQRSDISWIVEK